MISALLTRQMGTRASRPQSFSQTLLLKSIPPSSIDSLKAGRARRIALPIFAAVLAVCIALMPATVRAWSSDPGQNDAVCTASASQFKPQLISDGAGGAIITWEDFHGGGGFSDIYAQRLSSSGAAQWTANGDAVCTATGSQSFPQLISDGSGGAIIVWYDNRDGNFDVYVQRVNSSGVAQWTPNGAPVCTATGDQVNPLLVSDGAGGAIITWDDQRSGSGIYDIYAQRINSSGAPQWMPDGVSICTGTAELEPPQLISDGAGGAIITWWDGRSGSNFDIYAQRVNNSGGTQWTTDGDAVCTATGDQLYPKLISDGAGGAIIIWDDLRSGTYDIYAQRIGNSGVVQWTANGAAVCTATGIQSSRQLISDSVGGAIITWEDSRGGSSDIYAQRVDSFGGGQWTADGDAICTATGNQLVPQLISDGAGGAIIAWWDARNPINNDIYARRIDSSGAPQWTANGVAVCTATNHQRLPVLLNDGAGGAIITWEDNRNSNYDIYASRLTNDGLLGQTTVTQIVDTTFTTGTSGWTQFGPTNASQSASYNVVNHALVAHVNPTLQDNDYRIIGWLSAVNDTIHYASVGSSKFLRAKFYVYTSGQTGTALNEIPNFRARIASRFAYSAILQPYNHDNTDPEGTALARDIRPSTSPLAPSVYRVDLDPPDVPQLLSNPNTEGFLRLIEAYEGGHQGNGDLGLLESTIGTYPALNYYDNSSTVSVTQNGMVKSYRPGASDGGDFGNNITVAAPGITSTANGAITIIKNFNGAAETTGPMPSVTIDSGGVTMETLSVQSDRYGACALDTFNDILDQANHTTRARIEPGKQYRVRFHATSTKQTNTQALMRFRVRTLKFLYTANLEVGSSRALPPTSLANAAIAAQTLPGIGNQLPPFDRINPSEDGGWYNVMMVTPMNPDIQASQPNIYAQDGPGVDTMPANNSQSRRDIQFGIDIIDTFSTQPEAGLEAGQMTVDKVDIEKYNLLPD